MRKSPTARICSLARNVAMRSSLPNGPSTSASGAYDIFGRARRAVTRSRPRSICAPKRDGGGDPIGHVAGSGRKRGNRLMNVAVGKPLRLWFLDTEVVIRISEADGGDGISVLEHFAPFADSPP